MQPPPKTAFRFIYFFLLVFPLTVTAQNKMALGSWRSYLPYNSAYFVADAGNKVYCGTSVSLFSINKNDQSVTLYSKVNGLSDVGITALEYGSSKNVLFVGYDNSNIDLIFSDGIYNLSDIKRKNITGDKSIYNVTFHNQYAYVACGFGIVVINLDKKEIKETYYIGPNGNNIKVYDIATDGTSLFAATPGSILQANLNDPGINNYANWIAASPLLTDNNSANAYTLMAINGNTLLINHAYFYGTGSQVDSLLKFNTGNGTVTSFVNNGNFRTRAINVNNGKFVITNYFSASVWTSDLSTQVGNYLINNGDMQSAVLDANNDLWLADRLQGLVHYLTESSHERILLEGPESFLVADLKSVNNKLWVAHGPPHWGNLAFLTPGFSSYLDFDWRSYNKTNDPNAPVNIDQFMDPQALAVDQNDNSHVFISSYYKGLIEIRNNEVYKLYDNTNSSLQVQASGSGDVKVAGLSYDTDNNLWVVNSAANLGMVLHKMTPDGTWKGYSLISANPSNFLTDLLIDSYNQKWIGWLNNGIIVFDDATNTMRVLKAGSRKGNLPDINVLDIAEDHDGQIWIGTGKGVAVFYSASNVISDSSNDAQQILIEGDYINQYLLSSEVVTSIVVDGANRKWIGTQNAGAFLVSPDGTKQILNFTKDNSPLLSNRITKIEIDGVTGEVFFGTDKGLVSYQGDATEGEDQCKSITVFPNPVRPGYNGNIAIKGTVKNGNVKVTDVSGNLVYETTANGGMATWNGRNFTGERVQTGVYMVFVTNDDGENTCTTKLLFIN